MLLMNPKRHAISIVGRMGPGGKPGLVSSEPNDGGEALLMAAEDVTRALAANNASEFLASFKRFHAMVHAMEGEMEMPDEYDDD